MPKAPSGVDLSSIYPIAFRYEAFSFLGDFFLAYSLFFMEADCDAGGLKESVRLLSSPKRPPLSKPASSVSAALYVS